MTSRERVLAVLAGKLPDRVPWIENYISNEVMAGLVGSDNFVHVNYSHKIDRPGMVRVPPEIYQHIPLDNISYDLAPPRYAKTERIDGHDHITDGLIKTPDDLKFLDSLPDPDDESMYRPAEEFLKQYKGDLAAIATIRSGPGNAYLSMGIDHFCRCLVLEPDFVMEVMWRFSNWSKQVVKNMQELDFDLFFCPDDIGFGAAPMISPELFRKHCMPVMKNVFEAMKLPVIYHSDGNIMPLMDDIIGLGVAGIANFEPGPMDIEEVKELYGDKITIVGNIDLHYTLTRGNAEETMDEVRRRIEFLAPGGRYLLSSANSLPNYVKPANVKAMGEAVLKYGFYTPEMATFKPTGKYSKPVVKDTSIDGTVLGNIYLEEVRKAVISQDQEAVEPAVKAALEAGLNPEDIINKALIVAMDEVGQAFTANTIYVPEMLLAAMTMKKGLDVIKPLLKSADYRTAGKVVLATVKGDLHDIGKNILGMMLEGGGFEVIDLGINVDDKTIIDKVKEHKPQILALCSLLTTTMPAMKGVIDLMDKENLRPATKVMVGGAPVTNEFALEIKADGYRQDAASAVDLARSFCQ